MTRVLVCGGTGVLGRHLVPMLVGRGHAVSVLARSVEAAATIQRWGAAAVMGDIFDQKSLDAAAAGQQTILHIATSLPRTFPGRPGDFAQNDRVRREGTGNLLAAATRGGASRFVLQSIIWVHGDRGGAWIDEDAVLAPGMLARSAVDAEAMVREAAAHHGFAADILRCGGFYDAAAYHTREIVARLRSRTAPIIGGGDNYQCFVSAADAALAFALAAESSGPGDTCFVVDDEPVRLGDYLSWLAQAAGAPAPLRVPAFVARLAIGSEMVEAYGGSMRCRNDRIKRQLGWQPRFRDYRSGHQAVLAQLAGSTGK